MLHPQRTEKADLPRQRCLFALKDGFQPALQTGNQAKFTLCSLVPWSCYAEQFYSSACIVLPGPDLFASYRCFTVAMY